EFLKVMDHAHIVMDRKGHDLLELERIERMPDDGLRGLRSIPLAPLLVIEPPRDLHRGREMRLETAIFKTDKADERAVFLALDGVQSITVLFEMLPASLHEFLAGPRIQNARQVLHDQRVAVHACENLEIFV